MANFIYSQSFCQISAERKPPKKCFFFFCFFIFHKILSHKVILYCLSFLCFFLQCMHPLLFSLPSSSYVSMLICMSVNFIVTNCQCIYFSYVNLLTCICVNVHTHAYVFHLFKQYLGHIHLQTSSYSLQTYNPSLIMHVLEEEQQTPSHDKKLNQRYLITVRNCIKQKIFNFFSFSIKLQYEYSCKRIKQYELYAGCFFLI